MAFRVRSGASFNATSHLPRYEPRDTDSPFPFASLVLRLRFFLDLASDLPGSWFYSLKFGPISLPSLRQPLAWSLFSSLPLPPSAI